MVSPMFGWALEASDDARDDYYKRHPEEQEALDRIKYPLREIKLREHDPFYDNKLPPLLSELYCACFDSGDWPDHQCLDDRAKDALKALLKAYDEYLG